MADVIRRVEVRGVSTGLDKVATDLRGVAVAQKELAGASQATATVTEMSSRRQLSAMASLNALRGSLDSAFRAQQQFERGQTVINRAFEQGLISIAEQTRMLGLLQAKYDSVAAAAGRAAGAAQPGMVGGMSSVGAPALMTNQANERLLAGMSGQMGKLGSQTRFTTNEMANLGFQFQDIAVMAAAGQNPFTLIMQQGSQIVQVMMMSSVATMGLKAAMTALGASVVAFVLNPFNLALAGIAAVVGGIWLFAKSFNSAVPPLKDALDTHEKSVQAIAKAYKAAGVEARDFGAESQNVLLFQGQRSANDIRKSLAAVAEDVLSPANLGTLGLAMQSGRVAEFQLVQSAADDLREGLASGTPDIIGFRDALVSIQQQDPTNEFLRELTGNLIDLTEEAAKAQRALGSMSMPFDDERQLFRRERVTSAGDVGRAQNERLNASNAARLAYEAELQSLHAVTVEEQVAAAMARERATVMEDGRVTAQEELEITRAGALARAQAEHDLAEALRQRTLSMQDSIAAAQLELGLTGQTIGETARLTAEFEMLTDARNAAIEAGRNFIPEDEIARIKAAAAELAILAEKTALASMAQETLFKLQQMGRSDFEQGIADALHSAGLEGNDAAEGIARFNAELDRSIERADALRDGFSSVFHELRTGGDIAGALMEKLASWGEDMVTEGLFGAQGTTGQGLLGPLVAQLTGMPTAPAGLAEMANVAAMHVNATTVMISGGFRLPGLGESVPFPSNIVAPTGAASGSFRSAQEAGMYAAPLGTVTSVDLPNAPGTIAGVPVATWQQEAAAAAQRGGVDPNTFLKVLKSEGLQSGVWQSNVVKNGVRETSYGPGQFLVGGGLGDAFQKQTGLNLADQTAFQDPMARQQYMDFMVGQAQQGGWSPWYGAAKVGVSKWEGIGTGPTTLAAVAPPSPLTGMLPPPAPLTPTFGSYYPTPIYPPIQMGGNASTTLDIVGQMDAELLAPAVQSTQAVAGLGTAIGGLMAPLDQVVPGLGGLAQSIIGLVPSGLSGISPQATSAIAAGFGGFWAEGGELGAGKWGIAGEAGPEIIHGPASITPMRRGDGDGSRASSGPPIYNFNTTNMGDARARVEARENGTGGFDVEIFAERIKREVRDEFGLKPQVERWGR